MWVKNLEFTYHSYTFAVYYNSSTLKQIICSPEYDPLTDYNTYIYKDMIQTEQLTFRYRGQNAPIFSHLDLHFEQGNIYGLLGKNGTGKSTLIYLLSGLLQPQHGTAVIDGIPAAARSAALLRRCYLVPEEIRLPAFSLAEFTNYHRMYYPHFSTDTLRRCFEAFEVQPDRKLSALSMGQKKKVFMSFALAAGTEFLFMDEPTNGLDIPSKSTFRKMVAECMDEHRLMLISTHQIHDIEALIDHVVMLDKEGVLLNASVADLQAQYHFGLLQEGMSDAEVLYSEQSIAGRVGISRRKPDMNESKVDMELLFNAAVKGVLPR